MKKNKALLKVIQKVGSTTELARILGYSVPHMSRIVNGERTLPIRHIKKIVALSEGEVTKKDLRPDIFED